MLELDYRSLCGLWVVRERAWLVWDSLKPDGREQGIQGLMFYDLKLVGTEQVAREVVVLMRMTFHPCLLTWYSMTRSYYFLQYRYQTGKSTTTIKLHIHKGNVMNCYPMLQVWEAVDYIPSSESWLLSIGFLSS